jgi:hypothetical protein
VGPLFACLGIGNQEPETIWDDNDADPANEAKWLAFFDSNEVAIAASESAFLAEYRRRREITR